MGKSIKMTSGYEIPVLGFGTYQAADGEEAYQSILAAIKAGRRYSLRSLNVDLEPFFNVFWSTFGHCLSSSIKLFNTERTLLFSISAFYLIKCP